MNICSGCRNLLSNESNSLSDQNYCICTVRNNSIDDLDDTLQEFFHTDKGSSIDDVSNTLQVSFHVTDAKNLTSVGTPILKENCVISHRENGVSDIPENDGNEYLSVGSQKRLCKCKTFPCYGRISFLNKEDGSSEYIPNTCIECSRATRSRSMSLPPVSAMKGSREKQGIKPKERSVTWAPDVYETPPTNLLHIKSKGQPHVKNTKKNEKAGKNKQKGKGASRMSSKDKKSFRKISGNSNACFKTLDDRYRLVFDEYAHYDDLVEYDVPYSYCGSTS